MQEDTLFVFSKSAGIPQLELLRDFSWDYQLFVAAGWEAGKAKLELKILWYW